MHAIKSLFISSLPEVLIKFLEATTSRKCHNSANFRMATEKYGHITTSFIRWSLATPLPVTLHRRSRDWSGLLIPVHIVDYSRGIRRL